MTESPVLLVAKHNFDGKNNDELCFRKNDVIVRTQGPEGGWYEGTLSGKTGWFPANYVSQLSNGAVNVLEQSMRAKSPAGRRQKSPDPVAGNGQAKAGQRAMYRAMVLNDLIESERSHLNDLQALFTGVLKPMPQAKILTDDEYGTLVCNLEEIIDCQKALLAQLEQQASEAMSVYADKQGSKLMEVIQGLSKPFRRLDRYPISLQELERNMPENDVDRGDTQRAVSVYRDLAPLSELGSIRLMHLVRLSAGANTPEDRWVVLMPTWLIVFSAGPQLSGYEFRRKVSLQGLCVKRPESETEHILELSGPDVPDVLRLRFNMSVELNQWVEAFQALSPEVTCDESCHLISPTAPSHYNTVQNEMAPAVQPEVSTMPSPGQAELKKSSTLPPNITMQTSMVNGVNGAASGKKLWSGYCLRPLPAPRGHLDSDRQTSGVKMRRKSPSASEQEDGQILKVVEAYCTTAATRHVYPASAVMESPHRVLVAEDEKIIFDEIVNGEVVTHEKTLVDTVYALKDQVDSLNQDLKEVMRCLEKEQRARRRVEELLRRVMAGQGGSGLETVTDTKPPPPSKRPLPPSANNATGPPSKT